MVVLWLGLILGGSCATGTAMLVQGASWGAVAAGYVVGGWAALLTGLLLIGVLAAGRRLVSA